MLFRFAIKQTQWFEFNLYYLLILLLFPTLSAWQQRSSVQCSVVYGRSREVAPPSGGKSSRGEVGRGKTLSLCPPTLPNYKANPTFPSRFKKLNAQNKTAYKTCLLSCVVLSVSLNSRLLLYGPLISTNGI